MAVVVAASSVGGGQPAIGGYFSRFCDSLSSPRWQAVIVGETRIRLQSWQTMAALRHCYLVEGIIVAAFVSSLGLFQGNPISGSPGSDDGDARCHYSPRASFLEHTQAIGGSEVEQRLFSHQRWCVSRRGVVESRWTMCAEVRAQGGGDVNTMVA
jgi:hypothetical protein